MDKLTLERYNEEQKKRNAKTSLLVILCGILVLSLIPLTAVISREGNGSAIAFGLICIPIAIGTIFGLRTNNKIAQPKSILEKASVGKTTSLSISYVDPNQEKTTQEGLSCKPLDLI